LSRPQLFLNGFSLTAVRPPSVWKPYGEGIQDLLNDFKIDLYCDDFIKHHRKLDPMIQLAGDKPRRRLGDR